MFPQDRAELKRIWRTQKYVCAFMILRDAGLRPGKLAALRRRDWDSEIKFFPVLNAIESGSKDKIKSAKTGAAKPAIITDEAALEIEALRKKLKPKPDDLLFQNKGLCLNKEPRTSATDLYSRFLAAIRKTPNGRVPAGR